jgi:phosphate starvation-inducible PhoH-like protein
MYNIYLQILFLFVVMINKTTSYKFFSKSHNFINKQVRLYSKKRHTLNKELNKESEHNSQSPYQPITYNQKDYVKYLNDPNIDLVLGVGPAGTGKTLFACDKAIKELKVGSIKKIIITRPLVTVEEELGFLPGSINNKMDPWTRPIFDIFQEYYSNTNVQMMVKNNIIEIAPLAFMRGRTFKNAFIIADEMQNSSPSQMLMLATRIGIGSKLVITGDLNQSDRYENNGLKDFLTKYKLSKTIQNLDKIKLIEFNNIDIQRSQIVSTIIKMYETNN